ncbi:MAG: PAS domain S-box protein, partial [Candidatus Lokiarchaeota archaeon]|nr:PAS domain S-box protein [Candidatus Lokiarchaeota archaeon]
GKDVVGTILPYTEKAQKILNKMLKNISKNPQKYENIINENVTKYGKKVWISWTNKAIKDKDGNIIGIESVGNDITKRKRARDILKNETKKLEILNQIIISGNQTESLELLLSKILNSLLNLLDFSGGGIYLTDYKKKKAKLTHYKNLSDDIIERFNVIPIDEDPYNIVFIEGNPLYVQYFGEQKQNQIVLNSMATVPIFDNKQIIGALSVISSDAFDLSKKEKRILQSIGHEIGTIITKLKAEKLVKQNKENLENLFNSLNDFIFVLDGDGNILEVNKTVLERLGYTKKEITSMNVLDLHPQELRDSTKRQFEKIIKREDDYCELPLRTKNGELIEVSTKINHGKWGSSDVIFGISRDMEDKEKWEQKLIESEQKFRSIAETSFMGIMIIENRKIKYYNNALMDILEISEERELQNESDFSGFIHSEDREEWLKNLNNINSKNHKFNTIFQIKTRWDKIKWVEVFYKRIYYKKSYSEFITIMDISKRKKAEKLIIEEYDRLMELNELRKDIITRISHELKTPLTTMYGSSQLLLETYKDQMSEDVLEYVEMNHRGCVRLTKLIQNLIDATILDSNKMSLSLKDEDLVKIIQNSLDNISEMAKSRNISIDAQIPNEFKYKLDRERIEQAITNILSNAVKNTLPDGTITVKLTNDDEYVDISVKDTGIGLTDREKEKIFRKFGKIERYKMNVDLNIEGSGLGLYISKEIVELHGGEIKAESEGRNKGATFILRLPLKHQFN